MGWFQALIEIHFGVKFEVEKEKAGHLMVQEAPRTWGGGRCHSIVGPDAGYACPSKTWGFSYNGWAVYYMRNGEWKLAQDGLFSHRDKDSSNPFPELEEVQGYQE